MNNFNENKTSSNTTSLSQLGTTVLLPCLAVSMLLMTGQAQAQMSGDTFVFPSAGQTPQQQDMDTYQCQSWARQQTAFDPWRMPVRGRPAYNAQPRYNAPRPYNQPDTTQKTVNGAVGGALLGAALGAVVDGQDGAGKGALAGALLGGVSANAQSRRTVQNDYLPYPSQEAYYGGNNYGYQDDYGYRDDYAYSPPPPRHTQNTVNGAVGGALTGAALGAVVDGKDGAGKGALAGALLGGLNGNQRSRNNYADQQARYEQQQVAQYERGRANWNRAFAVCMEGSGYTVR